MEYSYQNSVIAQILEAIINASTYEGETGSNIADILLSILNETPYEGEANSVLAELFLELKAKIEGDPFTPYEGTYSGHIAEILLSILNETEYDKEPQSRIAELLLQLKEELEAYTEVTKSGAIANFTTNVSKPLVNLTAYFKATQEAGTPTPQSPKAISGVSAVSVPHCHKNLYQYDENKVEQGTTTQSTLSAFLHLGFKGVTSLTFSASLKSGASTTPSDYLNIGKLRKSDGLLETLISFVTPSNITTRTLSISSDDEVILISLENPTVIKSILSRYDIQIEVGSQATTYEPYNGSTILIDLGGTYYGGYISQDKDGHRQFEVTHKTKIKLRDLGYWNYSESGNRFYISNISDVLQKTDWNNHIGLCDCYVEGKVGNNQGDDFAFGFYNASLYLRDSNYSDVTTWLNAVGDYYITYQLATPFIIDLPDGEPITAFNGVNNIYNDSGDTSVTYLYKGEPPLQSPLGFGSGSSNSDPEEENIEEDTPIENTENIEEEV